MDVKFLSLLCLEKITNKMREVNNPGKQVEPVSLNTCVISHKNMCGVKPQTQNKK